MRARIELNSQGVRELLKSNEIKADLQRRAEAIARAAGPGFIADSMVGPNRARASVGTTDIDSMRAEAEDRVLTRAIDAGRA